MKEDKNTSQQSLFGESVSIEISKPEIPKGREWSIMERLEKEKELVGIYLSAHPLDTFKLEMNDLCTHRLADLNNLEALLNKDIVIAGMVTESNDNLLTKNGKNYGFIVLEDYSGSHRFMFFGNDFANMKQFIQTGYSLLINAKVQKRQYANKDGIKETEIKVKKIIMLSNAREDVVKGVTVNINAMDITAEVIQEFHEIAKANEGNKKLSFIIQDNNENVKVKMFSRTNRVNLSENFVEFLEKNPIFDFKFDS